MLRRGKKEPLPLASSARGVSSVDSSTPGVERKSPPPEGPTTPPAATEPTSVINLSRRSGISRRCRPTINELEPIIKAHSTGTKLSEQISNRESALNHHDLLNREPL